MSAAGAVGEFGPIVLISVALSEGGPMSLLFIVVFAAITLSCAYLAATARPMPATPAALLRVPLFLGLFLIARGVPVWLCRRDLPRGDWLPLALMSATALPLVVAVAEIGIETNRMKPETAAALVGAGMLSMLLFPALALTLRSSTKTPAAEESTS